nr:hypothetical protein [Tanacetum cinerariifolium]
MMKEHNINESMTPGKQWDKIREHDTSSRFENDTRAEDANIKTANDKEPMAEKYILNTNHDACLTKFLKEVNSRVKVQSLKTRNSIKPVEKITSVIKPKSWISKGYRISPNKSSAVHEKPNIPRSCIRWIPTGIIFNIIVGLMWVPTGKTFPSSTTKVDYKPPNGSNEDITNPYECDQTLNVSAAALNLRPMLHSLTLATFSSGLVSNNVSQQPCIPPNRDDWDHFFQPMFNEYFNPATIAVSSVPVVAAPRAVDLADSPVSTSINQDAPSTSIPSTQVQEHSLNISQGFEESPKTPIFF